MEKTVFEQMGGTYKQQGDYLIPCLALRKFIIRWRITKSYRICRNR